MKKNIITYVIGAILIAGGILLLINPHGSINSIVKCIGLVLGITGLVKFFYALYSNSNDKGEAIFSGVVNLTAGLILYLNSTGATRLISIVLGLWLVLSSASALVIVAIGNKKNLLSNKPFIVNAVKLLVGIIIIVTPVVTWIFTGLAMGIILIIIGIYVIISGMGEKSIYKVKVKK